MDFTSKTKNYGFDMIPKGQRNWGDSYNGNVRAFDKKLKDISDSVDGFDERIENVLANSGDDVAEIVDARRSTATGVSHKTIGARIAELEAVLSVLNSKASEADIMGTYTKIEYTRQNGTLFMVSKASNPDRKYNYQTFKLDYYDEKGEDIVLVTEYKITYDARGNVVSKSMVINSPEDEVADMESENTVEEEAE